MKNPHWLIEVSHNSKEVVDFKELAHECRILSSIVKSLIKKVNLYGADILNWNLYVEMMEDIKEDIDDLASEDESVFDFESARIHYNYLLGRLYDVCDEKVFYKAEWRKFIFLNINKQR